MSINRRELMQGIVASAIAASALPPLAAQDSTASKQSRIASSKRKGERQRLYLNEPTLARLKQRFGADKKWANQLVADGGELLAEEFIPESVAKEGGGQQAKYGKPAKQIADMGVTLGLLYELTQETKYAQKLYAAMQHYGQYSMWGGPGLLDRNPPWHSELDTGQFCFGFANGYDTLYHYLSEQQRARFLAHVRVSQPLQKQTVGPCYFFAEHFGSLLLLGSGSPRTRSTASAEPCGTRFDQCATEQWMCRYLRES